MPTLITGGAGFVGSHVAAKLLERGERVVAVDNFHDYYDPQLKRANAEGLGRHERATVIEADIRDAAAMRRIVESHGVARIGHMAAMAGVRMSVAEPLLYLQVNVEGTTNLLEAARHCGSTTFHVMGTCRMGPQSDPTAVVDDELKVRGVESLRVIDASIMPTMVSANLNAATMMVAEKGSDLVLGKTPLEAVIVPEAPA